MGTEMGRDGINLFQGFSSRVASAVSHIFEAFQAGPALQNVAMQSLQGFTFGH